jgi:hypothetical protein
MFYVLIFSILAVLLIVIGISTYQRRHRSLEREEAHVPGGNVTHSDAIHNDSARRQRKAKRAQSQHDRRKRH